MGESEDPAVQGANKAFETPPSGGDQEEWAGPGVAGEDSAEEGERQEGWAGPTVSSDDSPEDVGKSTRRSAEDIADAEDEEGRTTEGTKGKAERPYGTAEPESATGVDPQETVTGGPDMPPGDQGG
jgi:hypothetical protein